MRNKVKEKQGCCPDTHAKYFEIILIIGFILSFIILTINILLSLWFFKLTLYLLILGILTITLNFISHILAISLRIWRSDGSVLKKNFSSSSSVSCFLLVVIIINILSSILEEAVYILFYLIFILNKQNLGGNVIIEFILEKIIVGDENEDIYDEKIKKKIFKILPWIAFNFNLFVQILNLIIIIILMGRIKLKSHFGFARNYINQSTQNKMINSPKNKRKIKKGIFGPNCESDVTSLKKVKKRKKKFIKKRNIINK